MVSDHDLISLFEHDRPAQTPLALVTGEARHRHTCPARRWEEHPEDLIMSSLPGVVNLELSSFAAQPAAQELKLRTALESWICQCSLISNAAHQQTANP
jgi:hypothetical protein